MARRLRWAVNCSQWIPTKQEWLSSLSCLQCEEVERVGKFVYKQDYKLTLVGRLLIRAGLCHILGLHNDHVQLTRSEKGKPLLINELEGGIDTRVGFNISHQGDYSVLATESDTQVGVDVMQLTRPRGTRVGEFFHTMRRQFTTREWEQIYSTDTDRRKLNNFYRFWSLKESFIKAEGSGLSYGLQNLEFVAASSWPPQLSDVCTGSQLYIGGDLMNGWSFQESLLDDQHCVAVATQLSPLNDRVSDSAVIFAHLTVAELLDKVGHTHQHRVDWTADAVDMKWAEFCSKTEHPYSKR